MAGLPRPRAGPGRTLFTNGFAACECRGSVQVRTKRSVAPCVVILMPCIHCRSGGVKHGRRSGAAGYLAGPFALELHECDFRTNGRLNRALTEAIHGDRLSHPGEPYPDGESWQQASARVALFLSDLRLRWEGRPVLASTRMKRACSQCHPTAGSRRCLPPAPPGSQKQHGRYRLGPDR